MLNISKQDVLKYLNWTFSFHQQHEHVARKRVQELEFDKVQLCHHRMATVMVARVGGKIHNNLVIEHICNKKTLLWLSYHIQ